MNYDLIACIWFCRDHQGQGGEGSVSKGGGVMHEMHSNYISSHTHKIYATQLYNQIQTEEFVHMEAVDQVFHVENIFICYG